jgi:hypothetical protein
MLYLIGPDRPGAPIKLGSTSGLAAGVAGRLKALQVGNPERLYILNLYLLPDLETLFWEYQTHAALNAAARLVGEWFDPWKDVRIEHLARASSVSSATLIWKTLLPEVCWSRGVPKRSNPMTKLKYRTPLTAHHIQGLYRPKPHHSNRHRRQALRNALGMAA